LGAARVVVKRERAPRRTVEQRLLHRRREVPPWRVQLELEGAGERRQDDFPQVAARLAPREDDSLEDRKAGIAEDEIGVDLASHAEPRAFRASTEGRVERELPRLELRQVEPAHIESIALGNESRTSAAALN